MITLKVLGSSSRGNCFVINDNEKNIILDCGVKNVACYVDLTKTDGILITHCHLDHCRDVKNIKNYYNGKFYANKDVIDVLPVPDFQKEEIVAGEKFKVGNFEIMPFDVLHDVQNTNYLLKHVPSGIKILYVTDTGMIDYQFKDVDFFLIESNCDEDLLTYEDYKEVRLYETHLSMQQTSKFLEKNVNHNTKKILLGHISTSEQDYKKHERYVLSNLKNKNVEVIAINPNQEKTLEIVLKKDLIGFDFD